MSTAVWPPLYTQGNITLPADATLLQSTEQWTTIEKFAIAFGVGIYTLTVLATSVLNIYRQVPYVKIVGLAFVNIIVVNSILFWFSVLTTNRIIPQTGAFLVCTLWNIWVFYISLVTMLTALTARLWRLDLILRQRKAAVGWRAWLLPVAIWSPCIVYCIAGSIVGADGPYTFPQNGWAMCYLDQILMYVGVGHVVCIMIVYIALSVRLRESRSRIFNEYWDSIMSFAAFIVCVIIYVGLVYKGLQYQSEGRAAISIMVTIINNICLWAFLFRPVVSVLFRHKQALHAFKEAMSNKKIIFVDDEVHDTNSSVYRTHRVKQAVGWLSNVFTRSTMTGSGTALSGNRDNTVEMRSAASQTATDLSLKIDTDVDGIIAELTMPSSPTADDI